MQHTNVKKLMKVFTDENYYNDKTVLGLKEIVNYYDKYGRHQYHDISKYVNEKMKESDDSISYILNNIENMIMFVQYNKELCDQEIDAMIDLRKKTTADDVELKLKKLYDHIALEEERIKNNAALIRSSNKEIEYNVINTFNSIADNFQNKVDEISNSLNANIITVVGLFSAIIFVFFGGITTLSEAINGIWKIESKDELTIPLIIILLVGFIIFNIVFLLLYSISKIVNKNIGNRISGISARYYWVEEIREGCYAVYWGNCPVSKCYQSREKAERKAKTKNALSKMKSNIQEIFKRAFLRFPYVVVVNLIFILGIVYLYSKL